jgi:hypothetical protein
MVIAALLGVYWENIVALPPEVAMYIPMSIWISAFVLGIFTMRAYVRDITGDDDDDDDDDC